MLEIVFGLHPGHMDKRKSTLILSHRLNYQGAGPAGQSGGLVGDSKGPGLTVSSVGCLIWGGGGSPCFQDPLSTAWASGWMGCVRSTWSTVTWRFTAATSTTSPPPKAFTTGSLGILPWT
jgi:hypothetical protein